MNWIFGDVHGKANALRGLVKLVQKKDPEALFHFVGDFVDRGENSRDVVDIVMNLQNATCVRGNHDDVFDLVINGFSPYAEKKNHEDLNQYLWFCNFGLIDTLMSYDIKMADIMLLAEYAGDLNHPYDDNLTKAYDLLNQFRAKIPKTHKEFFKNLPLVNEQKDFFVIHAYFPHHGTEGTTDEEGKLLTIAEWLAKRPAFCSEALWGRFNKYDLNSERAWKKTGYFGHTPTKHYTGKEYIPVKGNKLVLVDTGSFIPEGRVTAFCHETGEYIQVDESGDMV